jgi:transcriptional regulator with XRE-family HTH domain
MRRNYLEVGEEEVLDWVKWRLRIFSDKELARILETSASTISKIRGRHIPLGAVMLLKILDITGIRASELSTLIKFTQSFDD